MFLRRGGKAMKKFYKENRVFVILMGIALVCIAIIIWMFVGYIIDSSTSNKYGNRLDGIKDVEIKDEKITEMETSILEMEKVQDVKINLHGKLLNFNISFEKDTTIDDAHNVSISCLEFFEEDYLNFYDLQFLVTIEDGKTVEEGEDPADLIIIGYRKAGATTITWSNNAKK